MQEAQRGLVNHHAAYSLGVAYAQLGQPREAARWLWLAKNTGFRCYPWYVRDPLLAPLRQDAAFRSLLTQLQGEWERDRALYRVE